MALGRVAAVPARRPWRKRFGTRDMKHDNRAGCAAFDPTPGDALEELAELWLSLGDRRRDGHVARSEETNRPNLKDAKYR